MPSPSAFLTAMLPHLKKGPTLDVACSEGHQALYLAQNGFEVLGIDPREAEISRAQALAQEKSGAPVTFKRQDLELFVVPLMAYATIVVSHFRAPLTLLSSLTRGLAPGGTLLIEAPLVSSTLPTSLKLEVNPSQGYTSNELLGFIKDLSILHYSELPQNQGSPTVRLLAQKRIKMG